ncbi:hypothetical protein ABS772_25405 [Methylorubrum podarium]|uniref:Uncharacterized protein n=1 Tax=Methylorubrum podarium TaxID=200476 RepID=A0ABV1QV16_9HYPH
MNATVMVSDHAVAFLRTVMVRIGNPITSIISPPACLLSLATAAVGYSATSPVPGRSRLEVAPGAVTIAIPAPLSTRSFNVIHIPNWLMKTFSQA